MIILQGFVKLDVRRSQLAEFIGVANIILREVGKEENAVALFRLRTKIREGLFYEAAKPIFNQHTKSLFEENS